MCMKKRGFTLIELTAVAAIVSTLSIGTYHAVQRGKSAQCINNLKQLYQSISMFAMDHGTLPDAKFFPSSKSDRKGFHNILAQYGARGDILFCPSVPAQLNGYGTNYIWNDTFSGKSLDSAPPSAWLMTEMTAVSLKIPAPHTRGFNILFAGGNARTGDRVSFPAIPAGEKQEPPDEPLQPAQTTPVSTSPRLHIRAPQEARAGEKVAVSVSMTDPSGKAALIENTVLEISSEAESTKIPDSIKVEEGKASVEFDSIFYKTGRTTLKVADTGKNISAAGVIKVLPGEPFSLDFTEFPEAWVAGEPRKVTLVCYDRWKNICDYSEQLILADRNTGVLPFSFSLNKGRLSEEIAFEKAAENNTLYAAAGKIVSSGPEFSVSPSAPQILEMETPGETIAGIACEVKVKVKDIYANTCTGYTGAIEITLPEDAVSESKTLSFAPEDLGEKSFTLIFFSSGKNSVTIGTGDIRAEKEIFVNPGALNEYRIREIGAQEAGKPFDIIVRASDSWGNQVKGFYLKDSSGSIKYVNRDFAAGMWMETLVITKAGIHTIYLEDSFGKKGSSNSFIVKPSSPAKIEISGVPFLLSAGEKYTGEIIFMDSFNNTISDYTGEISIEPSGELEAFLIEDRNPVQFSMEAGASGYHTLKVADKKTGFQAEKAFLSMKKEQ